MKQTKNNRTAIYARVSTLDQDPGLQLRELRAYAQSRGLDVADEFIDKISGTKDERPELNKLWQAVKARKVDIVLVWKFDRFARSTKQLIDALEEFRHFGIDFISLTEQIDTSSPMGKAMFTMISAIAEFERSLISERVRAGIARSRAQGKPHGRAPIDQETVNKIRELRAQNLSIREISRQLGVGKGTVTNYTK